MAKRLPPPTPPISKGFASGDSGAVAISSASNPDGDNPPAQRAANVIAGALGTKPSSKWLAGRMSEPGRSLSSTCRTRRIVSDPNAMPS